MKPNPNRKRHLDWFYWAQADWSKTNAQVAKEAGVSMLCALMWRKKIGAPPSDKRNHRTGFCQSKTDEYKTWDWTLRDVELGRLHGISRERVRQIRKSLNIPASPHKHLHRNGIALRGIPVETIRSKTAEELASLTNSVTDTIYKHCRMLGVRPLKRDKRLLPIWALVNWELGNRDLARIWKLKEYRPAQRRYLSGKGAAKYDGRASQNSLDYHEAIAAEKQKAAEYFNGKEQTKEMVNV